jgi:uncharacterized protein
MKLSKYILIGLISIYLPFVSMAQFDTVAIKQSIQAFQSELNHEYREAETSPLNPEKLKNFKGLLFFPVNLNFTVQAKLTITPEAAFFKMMTSSNQVRDYRQYGILTFTLSEKEFVLPVYQSQQLMKTEEYANYLFCPFTDLSNGKETYAAGRYIDLRMPTDGDVVLLDFNKAYNPLCAYSNRYSCPIVPKENHLAIEIPVGVQYNKAE